MRKSSRENVLMQLGHYCSRHACGNCFVNRLASEHDLLCPEILLVPEVAEKISDVLKHRRIKKQVGDNENA